MTINMSSTASSLCNIVQCFPILLILAQKYQYCLDTHLIYKPPEPTTPPVSYDVALNTLLHAIANRPHGNDYGPHDDHDHHHYPYDHSYGQGYGNPSYIYGTSHGNGYGIPYYGTDVKAYANSYNNGQAGVKVFTTKDQSGYGQTYASGVKVYAAKVPSNAQYGPNVKVPYSGMYIPEYGKDQNYYGSYGPNVKVIIPEKGYGYRSGQTYAAGTKVYPLNVNNYKVVVKRRDSRSRKKSAKLTDGAEEQDDSCVAISGALGNCINIRRCQQYLVILQNAQTNPNAVEILRRSHCGFDGNDPKVCCPNSQPIPTVPPPFPTGPLTSLEPQTQAPEPQTPEPPPPDSNVHMPDDGSDSDFVSSLPDPPECGFSNASFSRVVGGIPAKLGDFPWMALLGYHSQRFPGTARWLCGGTLVTKKHVLTAAHCLHGREDDLYIVRLGELDLSREDDGATPIDVPIKKKIKHETYSAKSFTNDIAILVLVRSVQSTDLIRPICLPKTAELRALTFERYNPLIAGWGDTQFRGPAAPHLQVLQLPVVSNQFCADAYKAYKAQVIDERVLCAGFEQGGKDACQGDSGGPLMQPVYNRETYNTFFYQIGVVSFGRKCAEAGFPGVYSRTTHFMPWLYNQLVGSDQS